MTLRFTNGNRKIKELAEMLGLSKNQIFSFDLPAGYTCPMADKCLSFANRENGKITDGKNCQFRCYAASLESAFTNTRKLHWENFDTLKASSNMANLILSSLPATMRIVRIHASGDFFSEEYFQAWVKVAQARPDIKFFGYTKILNYVKASKPENFKLHYSFGGKMDKFITDEPVAYVVKSKDDANNLNVRIACAEHPADDYAFIMRSEPFALMLHGTQPAKA